MQFAQSCFGRFATSPFLVDLVADNERIEEEMSVRQQEERRRQKQQELKKKKVKNEIIVKALSEVPSSEQVHITANIGSRDVTPENVFTPLLFCHPKARANKRMMYEEEKRLKALRDLERVDQLWERKVCTNDLRPEGWIMQMLVPLHRIALYP